MGTKNLWLAAACIMGLSLVASPANSFAAEPSVQVSLPGFSVKLNGHTVDNPYREYPLIVYKDITYFPMTWYDSRLLGLETGWSEQGGLSIAKADVTSSYMPYRSDSKNANGARATIPSFDITINGKTVDNLTEPYPLLSYRDITYFPLTWKFAHDEFGWDYVWDNASGLSITSDNPKLQTVELPAPVADNGAALLKGYYYYAETDGNMNLVYRAPETDTSSKELVYSYDGSSGYGVSRGLRFWIDNDELWFSYHLGGATMGSDVYCKVNADGKATVQHRGYLDFRKATNGTVLIRQSVPPSGGNMALVPAGEADNKGSGIGNPNFIYGWYITVEGESRGFAGDKSTTVIDDDIYALATPYPVKNGANLNRIYKINVKTNETTELTKFAVRNFKVIGGKLYYVKEEDGLLYASNSDGSGEQQVSDRKTAGWFNRVGNRLYYTVANENGGFQLYRAESGEDALVVKESLDSVQLTNDRILCKFTPGGDYGFRVLDAVGEPLITVTDQVSRIFAHDGSIVFVSSDDSSIKRLNL